MIDLAVRLFLVAAAAFAFASLANDIPGAWREWKRLAAERDRYREADEDG